MSLSFQDRIEIQDLLVRYAYAIDIGSTEEDFLALFTDDAELLSPISGSHIGAEGLKKFLRRHEDHKGKLLIRHFITNVIIDGSGDEARLRAYFVEYETDLKMPGTDPKTKTRFLFCGNYDCTAVRVAGKWKLKTRTVYVDHVSPQLA